MEFCPKCDSLLHIMKDKKTGKPLLKCPDCDYIESKENVVESYIISDEISHTEKDTIEMIEVSEEDNALSADIREELTEQFRESIESFEF